MSCADPHEGEGWYGRAPMFSHRKGTRRSVTDGGGLCSPGRWPPERRVLPDAKVVRALWEARSEGFTSCFDDLDREDSKRELLRISGGQRDAAPFKVAEIERS